VIPRIPAVRLPPRAVILFLIAIVLPCSVLAGLTVRMMTLQRELVEKRRADARRALIVAIRSELSSRLERLKLHGVPRGVMEATAENDGVVLVAPLENGRVRLPWTIDAAATGASLYGSGAYSDAIRVGEHGEHQPHGLEEARAAYARALAASASPVQAAFARLGLSRTLDASGRTRDAALEDRRLLRTPLTVRDDSGTPFALYAARRELGRGITVSVDYQALADVLEACLVAEPPLPPTALYMARDLAESLAGRASEGELRGIGTQLVPRLTTMSREREQAESLQEALAVILPAAASSTVTDVPWTLFGPKEAQWLVSAGRHDSASVVVGVRLATFVANMQEVPLLRANGIRVVSTGTVPGAEPLDGLLPALSLTLGSSEPDSLVRQEMLQRRFYIVALFLVIGIAWCGGYFFWQHVRRDLRVAEMRSQFVSSVSHELKTPLTSIRMFAETLLLGRTARPETRDEYLETIVNESERLTRLINNVLEFSKIEQRTKTYRLAQQSLAEIIEASARVMEYPLLQKGFELRRNLDRALPRIPVDRDAIQQAVLNLLSNAMKYSGASRTIELTLSRMGGEVQISVSDRGCGIAAAEQGRVFQKFYRSAAAEHQHVPGTGLGLTIVEHVAAAHGGRVAVTSAVGLGSTFSIVLPIPVDDDSQKISGRTVDSAHASHPGH
jgi:signal transduction histidine kinase